MRKHAQQHKSKNVERFWTGLDRERTGQHQKSRQKGRRRRDQNDENFLTHKNTFRVFIGNAPNKTDCVRN